MAEDVLETMERSRDPKVRAYLKGVIDTILTVDPNLPTIKEQRSKDLAVLSDLNRPAVLKDPKTVDRVFSEEAIMTQLAVREQFRTGRGIDTHDFSPGEIEEFKKVFNHERKMW